MSNRSLKSITNLIFVSHGNNKLKMEIIYILTVNKGYFNKRNIFKHKGEFYKFSILFLLNNIANLTMSFLVKIQAKHCIDITYLDQLLLSKLWLSIGPYRVHDDTVLAIGQCVDVHNSYNLSEMRAHKIMIINGIS